jgi:hypothetical protein
VLPGGEAPAAVAWTDVDLDDAANTGRVVRAEGEVERRTAAGFTLGLADGESLRVIVPRGVDARYPVGTSLAVTGVLGRSNAGPRLLVRSADDVVAAAPALVPAAVPVVARTNDWLPYAFTTAAGVLALALVAVYRWWTARAALPAGVVVEEEDTV